MWEATDFVQPGATRAVEPWRRNLNSFRTSLEISFRHILYATDFSGTAGRALPYAIEIARRSRGTIHAMHVIPPEVYPGLPPDQWAEMARKDEELRARKQSQLELELQELPHEFIARQGDVAECVKEAVKSVGADLLVLGTHGRTGIAKALMGSVAEKIFRQATCPVLAVGPAVNATAPHAAAAELNRILYATDLSPESLAAARYAISLATDHRADLILLHTVESETKEEEDISRDTLEQVVPLGACLLSRPECIVEQGPPAEAILETSRNCHADLIVLGAHDIGRGLTTETHLSRSIAALVAAKAACPVLIVHS